MKKVYLNTPEEVIKALKDGKEVCIEDDNVVYKMVEDIIIGTKEEFTYVGDSILMMDKPYILEEEQIKLEVGKFYRTRNNSKVCCYFVNPRDVDKGYCCNCVIVGTENYLYYKKTGRFTDKESQWDIVEEWKD